MAKPRADVEAGMLLSGSKRSRLGDAVWKRVMMLGALGLIVLLVLIVIVLAADGSSALRHFGFGFLTDTAWFPTRDIFGAAPYIYSTILTSVIALVLGVPVAVGLALFVTEVCPKPLRAPLATLSDLLAAIPSVVYGLWGIFVLAPWMGTTLEPALRGSLGHVPGLGSLFSGDINGGYNILTASVILAIMILPIVSSISREVLATVPRELRDGAYALGATRYEVIRGVTLPFARGGVIGASMLGLGRALGETIAVTMVIGSAKGVVTGHLFRPADTIASVIASNFNEAGRGSLEASTLVSLALILVVISLGFAALARLLVRRTTRQARAAMFARGSA